MLLPDTSLLLNSFSWNLSRHSCFYLMDQNGPYPAVRDAGECDVAVKGIADVDKIRGLLPRKLERMCNPWQVIAPCHNYWGSVQITRLQLRVLLCTFQRFHMQMYVVTLPLWAVSHNYLIIDSFCFRTSCAMTSVRNNLREPCMQRSCVLGCWQSAGLPRSEVPLFLTRCLEGNPDSH